MISSILRTKNNFLWTLIHVFIGIPVFIGLSTVSILKDEN